MATKKELIGGLEFLIQESRRIAASLTPEEWAKASDSDGWKNTQVLAHVAGVGGIIVPFITALSNAPPGADFGAGVNIDEINAGIVLARVGKTPAELAEEAADAYGDVIAWLRDAPEDLLEQHVTMRGHKDISISDMLMRMTVLHGLGHVYEAYSAVFFG